MLHLPSPPFGATQLGAKVLLAATGIIILLALAGSATILTSLGMVIAMFISFAYCYYAPDREGTQDWLIGGATVVAVSGFIYLATIYGLRSDDLGTPTITFILTFIIFWLLFGAVGIWGASTLRFRKRIQQQAVTTKEQLLRLQHPSREAVSYRSSSYPFMDMIAGICLCVFSPFFFVKNASDVGFIYQFIISGLFFLAGVWVIYQAANELMLANKFENDSATTEGKVFGSWIASDAGRGRIFFLACRFGDENQHEFYQKVSPEQYEEIDPGDTVTVCYIPDKPSLAQIELDDNA